MARSCSLTDFRVVPQSVPGQGGVEVAEGEGDRRLAGEAGAVGGEVAQGAVAEAAAGDGPQLLFDRLQGGAPVGAGAGRGRGGRGRRRPAARWRGGGRGG